MSQPVPLDSIHHVELVVGNAKQAAYYYRKAFGFSQIAYRGPETGHPDAASYALRQGRIQLVLTTPIHPEDPLSEHLRRHGDGVRDIAVLLEDADAVHREVTGRGAQSAIEPRTLEDAGGQVRQAAVRTYGDTIHSFYSVKEYDGPFLPGFRPENVGISEGLSARTSLLGGARRVLEDATEASEAVGRLPIRGKSDPAGSPGTFSIFTARALMSPRRGEACCFP